MVTRLSSDARRQVLMFATQEAQRRGDRRLGTDHLLLGLLHEPEALPAQILGVGLRTARDAAETLDLAALAAAGIHIGHLPPAPSATARRRPALTSGARAVLQRAVLEARASKARHIDTRHLLLALLCRERPDPAAELLSALGIDSAQARQRLAEAAD